MAAETRFAIIVARFPKLTETFILQELGGLEDRGLDFELFSLIHESPDQRQTEAEHFEERAHYFTFYSPSSLATQWYWFRRGPRRWFQTWWQAFRMSRRQRILFIPFPMTVLIAMQMARRMEEIGIERVHSHWATYPTLAAYVIKRLTGIPYSFTGHATDIFNERSGLPDKVGEADFVATCLDYTAEVIRRRCGDVEAQKVEVIHHGTDLARFSPMPLRHRQPSDPLRVLCVAGLHPYKGQRHLIDAVARLDARGVAVELHLIGDGEDRAALEEQARSAGLTDVVTFFGRQRREVVLTELEWCDVFGAASIQTADGIMDGIPNVLVEALAAGRPVVASSLPGIRELIIDGETGLLAPPADPEGFANQLHRLAKEPALAADLVEAGRAKVEAEHDARKNLDRMCERLVGLSSTGSSAPI